MPYSFVVDKRLPRDFSHLAVVLGVEADFFFRRIGRLQQFAVRIVERTDDRVPRDEGEVVGDVHVLPQLVERLGNRLHLVVVNRAAERFAVEPHGLLLVGLWIDLRRPRRS